MGVTPLLYRQMQDRTLFEVILLSVIREFQFLRTCRTCMLTLALVGAAAITGKAQSTSPVLAIDAALGLPDAPGAVSSSLRASVDLPARTEAASGFSPAPQQAMASTTDMYILPGQPVPRLTAGNKFAMGVKDSISPFSMAGWVASALYAQALNGAPNYGSNGRAFTQRLGASAARASSEDIFSNSIMAPILHEDPRYYKMGRGHSFLKRTIYAATRTIITRSDDGHATANLSLITGNMAGAALTNLYYPQRNRTFSQTTETFAGSIGGSALGFVVSEFLSDTLKLVHLSNSE